MSKPVYEIRSFIKAIQQGNKEQVKNMLAQNPQGYNTLLLKKIGALGEACSVGQTECARILIEYGASIKKEKNTDLGPLHIACLNGQIECVQLLIDHGADINELSENCDSAGVEEQTPLHMACYSNADPKCIEKIIRLLVSYGANINAQDSDGQTPLHYVYFSPRLIAVLLEMGADPNIKDNSWGQGKTVLDLLREKQYGQIGSFKDRIEFCIKLLKEHRAQQK